VVGHVDHFDEEPPLAVRRSLSPRESNVEALIRRHPCGVCHNPDFSGREQMPRLANQREDHLLKAMREYKAGTRIGYAGAMAVELRDLTEGDLEDLAYFLARLPRAAP